MQLHPTRATFHVALAGAGLVALGVAMRAPHAIGFGGAMLLAVTLGRALALSTVTRIRASGFEMVFRAQKRVTRATCGEAVVLEAELRNRGVDDARGLNLRPVASSFLDVRVSPSVLDLPARSKVRFEMHVTPKRVGRWGVHGIALEVRGTPLGGEGLYEVPLMFANPHGLEVVPKPLHVMLASARGGRTRRSAEAGRPARRAGEGEHLKELREHVPGDPFKRIAWKASARRGQLLVREMEREDRDVVWLVLDASVELWAGDPGHAPLDATVEEVAGVAARHLGRGDRVGLAVYASRTRTFLAPEQGSGQAAKIALALASAASMVDADRTELDEMDVATRVAEHLRPLDPRGMADVPRTSLDALVLRAESLRARAPFAPRLPFAPTTRDQQLRHYLASFGIEVLPRASGERERADATLAEVLRLVTTVKKDVPSIVHVFAPAPQTGSPAPEAVKKLRARRVDVRWTLPRFLPSLTEAEPRGPVESAVREAVRLRVDVSEARATRALRKLGVRASHVRRQEGA